MNTEDNIEKTLNSFDGFKRPQTSPFLYDRIMNGIESAEAKIISMPPFQRWSIAAGIAVLIALNVFSARHYSNTSKNNGDGSNAFAKEYFSYLNNQY